MSVRPPLTLASLLLSFYTVHGLAAPLSDFERFRSYPFLERSYREAKADNWKEVERLTRHLLERVPNNSEARALLIQALAHQRRYREAEQLAEAASSSDADALLELRLTWIEQDPPAASRVEGWIATSSLNQRIRLWQAYSLSLAKFGGAAKALEWLNHLPAHGDDNILRLARANWAEQLRNWSQTIAALAPLAERGELPAQDWQRLANAYVQRLDEAPLQQLLKQAPTPEIARQTRLAMANRAIAMGHTELAQRWLQSLPEQDLHDPANRRQLWELARQGDDAALVRRLSNELNRPCLETTEWLSRHDPQAAREQLKGCRADDNPKAWLVLNQRLQGPGGEARSAQMWERLYRQSGDLQALEQASFLQLKEGRKEHVRQLLEQAYDRRQGRLPQPLLQRLAGLYSADDAPLDSRRMAGLIPRVDAANRALLLARLAERGQCDTVRQAIPATPSEVGQLRALGRCAMPERPGEAVVYYQAAADLGDTAAACRWPTPWKPPAIPTPRNRCGKPWPTASGPPTPGLPPRAVR